MGISVCVAGESVTVAQRHTRSPTRFLDLLATVRRKNLDTYLGFCRYSRHRVNAQRRSDHEARQAHTARRPPGVSRLPREAALVQVAAKPPLPGRSYEAGYLVPDEPSQPQEGYQMNKPVRLWIDALRSGTYVQGQDVLRDDNDHYCCLGVACDLYQREVGDLLSGLDGNSWVYDGQDKFLPHKVRVWLGINDESGSFYSLDQDADSLTRLNDGGFSFSEIADTIESEPEGLFA